MIKAVIFLKLLSAAILAGGCLSLLQGVALAVFKGNDFSSIEAFISGCERIGVISLLFLVVTPLQHYSHLSMVLE